MTAARSSNPIEAEPAWDVALLFPLQGEWSEQEYLDLAARTNRLIELVDGRLEVLPMPDEDHQYIIWYLMEALRDFVKPRRLGKVLFAGIPVRLAARNMREPDVVFVLAENVKQNRKEVWNKADLVMEVVSKGDPGRDRKVKRKEYAEAGIREYWIVEPTRKRIMVLTLPEGETAYAVTGEFGLGAMASSVLIPGFAIDVTDAMNAGDDD